MSRMFELVKQLTELPGPTNYEDPVQDALEDLWEDRVEDMWRDSVGNLVARWGGSGRKVLIGAHADEICLLVKSITSDGFIWPTSGTGGSELKNPNFACIGQPVKVIGDLDTITGMVVTVTGHIQTAEQRETVKFSWKDVFVDVGASSREELESAGVRPGSPIVFDVPTRRLGNHIVGKAMDDRAALAVMTSLLEEVPKEDLNCEVYLTSTVQEEVGLVGAVPAMEKGFDVALALDVGLAGDIPPVGMDHFPGRLGGGPLLGYKDASVHYDKGILGEMQMLARDNDMKVQPVVFLQYSSDGAAWIRHGLPSALLAFPTRYTHSPFETVNEKDLVDLRELMALWLRKG
ncbi:MAG: M42 family metallopeptidase [Bacillota bacterium]